MDAEIKENKNAMQAELSADVEAFLADGGKIQQLSNADYKHERTQTKKELLQQQKKRTHALHFARTRKRGEA